MSIRKKYVQLILGFASTGIFLWLIFRQVNLLELKKSFLVANLPIIFLAIVIFFIGFVCRAERWRLMLMEENSDLKWKNCFGPLIVSFAANNILPFRAGDILRIFGFNHRLRISATTSFASFFIEKLLELLMAIIFLVLALVCFKMKISALFNIGRAALICFGIIIVFLLCSPETFRPIASCLARFIARFFPGTGETLLFEIQKFFTILKKNAEQRVMRLLFFLSLLAWIAEGLTFWLVALSLPSLQNQFAAWLAFPIGTLATVIPSAPGHIGSFDYFTTQAMAVFGNSISSSASYAFLVHFVLWLPPLIVAGAYLLIMYKLRDNH